MTQTDYTLAQLSATAQRAGLAVGALWTLSFVLYMQGLRLPLLTLASLALGLFSVRPAARWAATAPRRLVWPLAMATYFCATLVTTLMQYLYFRFLDGGQFLATLHEALRMPEMQPMLHSLPPGTIEQALSAFAQPAVLAVNFFWGNLMAGLVLSLPTLVVALNKQKQQ